MKEQLLFLTLLFIFFCLSTSLGFIVKDSIIQDKVILLLSKPEVNNCSRNDLISSSKCLREQLREFYKYNLSNSGKELTFEELKEVGGVCSHYSEFYKNNLEELGFYTELKDIFTNESGHEFTIAWNNNLSVYCTLDQLNINCINLEI